MPASVIRTQGFGKTLIVTLHSPVRACRAKCHRTAPAGASSVAQSGCCGLLGHALAGRADRA